MLKRIVGLVGILAVGVTLTALAQSSAAGGAERLGWMAGCWELKAGARTIHEQWMAPLGGMMMGMSRTVVRDTVREFEQIRVETRAGRAQYVARPSGAPGETVFPAATLTDTLVVFSNPAHDFPHRIIYRLRGTDSLLARIEGDRNGQTRGIDFPMRRIRCGG